MMVYRDPRIIEPKQFHRPRVRACGVNLKHHTASGRGVFSAPLPPNQTFTTPIIVRIEAAYSTNPPTPVNANLSPATRSQNLSTRYSGARPAKSHTPSDPVRLSNTVRKNILPNSPIRY